MNKIKFALCISLLFVLLLSLSSISAADSNLQDDSILMGDSLSDNGLKEKYLSDDIHQSDEQDIKSDNLDDGSLDKNMENDSDVAKDINVSFSKKAYQNDTGTIDIELPDNARGNLRVAIDGTDIYNESISSKSVKVPILIPKSKFPYIVINRDYQISNDGNDYAIQNASNALQANAYSIQNSSNLIQSNGYAIQNGSLNRTVLDKNSYYETRNMYYLLPYWDIDYSVHMIEVFYNNISLDFDHDIMIMKYNQSYDYIFSLPKEMLKDDKNSYQMAVFTFPRSVNSSLDIYIDDELYGRFNASHFLPLNMSDLNSLNVSNHTIRVEYAGDDYYLPSNRTFTYELLDMIIEFPTNVVLDHDDCIYARLIKNTDGNISVYIDGKRVINKPLDKYHEFLQSLFKYITCGEHLLEVKYLSKKYNRTKSALVNVSYTTDIFGGSGVYGDENSISIIVPPDFNKSRIKITIDSKEYSKFFIDDSGWIDLDVSKLKAGNHTLFFDFYGDDKYYAKTMEYNFTVRYEIQYPDMAYYKDGSSVSLSLPADANGSLKLYLDGKLYKTAKLNNGYASIRVDNLSSKDHNFTAIYSGSDYEVENVSSSLYVYPKLYIPSPIRCGENKSMSLEFSKDTKGKAIFSIEKYDDNGNLKTKNYTVQVKNGKASLSLKGLDIGEYDIDIEFIGSDGFTADLYGYVEVLPAKIRITGAKDVSIAYTQNSYYNVKIYNNRSKLAKGVTVSFKIGKTTYKVKTDKNGIAKIKLSNLAPGKYTITVSYKNVKVSKKITVRHILKLKTVKVKKRAKKLVLTASLAKVNGKYLKGKLIKFKFNGKVYKAKTNSKGVAKITIKRKVLKKLKRGKKISYQATYLKDSVKKTAKVKK